MAPPPVTTAAEPNTANVECNALPALNSANIKQEKRDDRAKHEKLSTKQQTPSMPIAFSITNILSNNFGHTKLPTNNNQLTRNNNKVNSEKKCSVLFRPYDDDCGENGAPSPAKQSKIDRRQQSDDDDESNGEYKLQPKLELRSFCLLEYFEPGHLRKIALFDQLN